METIAQRFERVKKEHRDISEHLDTLLKYAQECDSIVELGVNEGISTTAFLKANKKFFNIDVHITPMFQELINMCKEEKVEMNFTLVDDRIIEIPECDLLFIDTLHIFKQLEVELSLHGNKAKKYIILHDTETFKDKGIDGSVPGMQQAVDDFLENNSHWYVKEHYKNCNGLTILSRKENENMKKNKKYLLATSAFVNNDLLKICIKSWPKESNIVDKLVFFDGENWESKFKNLLDNNDLGKCSTSVLTLFKHMGVAGGWNQILKYAFEDNDYENVIIVGSDTDMQEGFFDKLIKEREESKSDFSCCMGYNCFIMNKRCYEIVGKFDEGFFPCYFEDNDFDYRVRKSCDKVLYQNVGDESLLKHYGSAVIRLNDNFNTANGITFSMNREYYIKKWGGNPTEEKFEHPYNNSELSLKDIVFDEETYIKKKNIWKK